MFAQTGGSASASFSSDRKMEPAGELISPQTHRLTGKFEGLDTSKQFTEHESQIEPSQLRPDAEMGTATSECHMIERNTRCVEDIRIGEMAFIAVG
jgi:hypothetical protein